MTIRSLKLATLSFSFCLSATFSWILRNFARGHDSTDAALVPNTLKEDVTDGRLYLFVFIPCTRREWKGEGRAETGGRGLHKLNIFRIIPKAFFFCVRLPRLAAFVLTSVHACIRFLFSWFLIRLAAATSCFTFQQRELPFLQ